MDVQFSRKFAKQYDLTPANVREAFHERLQLFLENVFHPILNNHALAGKWNGCRSINVTGDWRAVFQEREHKMLMYFVAIGTHSKLYR